METRNVGGQITKLFWFVCFDEVTGDKRSSFSVANIFRVLQILGHIYCPIYSYFWSDRDSGGIKEVDDDTPCAAHICSERWDDRAPHCASLVCKIQRAHFLVQPVPYSVLAVPISSSSFIHECANIREPAVARGTRTPREV